MKKIFAYSIMFALAAFGLTSCGDKDSEGLTSVTSYAVLTMNGDAVVTISKGESFDDPGCTAVMGGEDVSEQIQVVSNVNTSQLGFYTVNYRVVNPDGFAASASRMVVVVDRNSFASTYLSRTQYGSRVYTNLPIVISDNGDGTYEIDDLAGGLYCYGRYPGYDAYGYDFFYEATIQLNADNTITQLSGDPNNWYWQLPLVIADGTYDPETGTVELLLDFDGDPMYVTLTK